LTIFQTAEELDAVARLCPNLTELRGLSVGVLDEREKHAQVKNTRDAPDTDFAGYPADRISG
jgi:hypothetical protein